MEQQGWPGFSPGPMSVSMSPEHLGFDFSHGRAGANNQDQAESPLVFMRTPGGAVQENTCPDSTKRFNAWLASTSPYTARKTPPTASMKSVAAMDENTPPGHDMAHGLSEKGDSFSSQQHFQSWLRATSSTNWTPRKSPAAATPPPAPAPSPAATPMSIIKDLPHSAATPPSSHRVQLPAGQRTRAQAAAGDGFDTSDEEEDDAGEASTTIGAAQLAAAADRAAAASRMASQQAQQQQRQLSTPPRVPAPSPMANSPAPLGLQQQQQQASLLQAAADRMVQDSLATPMSQLSLGERPGAQHGSSALTPGLLVDRSFSRAASGPPASPAEKLIGLMMSPGAEGHGRHHHHHHTQQQAAQMTPSRLSSAMGAGSGAQPPLSPNMQVIDLMMHPDAAVAEQPGSSAGASPRAAAEQQAQADQEAGGADQDSGSDVGSEGSGSVYDSESDDEMNLAELQALVGEGVGPDTPLSVILGMLTGTPEVRGLTPHLGAPEQQQATNDDIGPRVLFADD